MRSTHGVGMVSGTTVSRAARLLEQHAGVLHGAQIQQLETMGEAGIGMLAAGIRGATGPIEVELFGLCHAGVIDALAGAANRGVPVRVLADPELVANQAREVLIPAGVKFTSYGESAADAIAGRPWDIARNPRKVHAKFVTWDDGTKGWMSTASLFRLHDSIDVSALVGPETARHMAELTRVGQTDSRQAIVAAAADAARDGVVLNDPVHGVHHLTDAYESLITGAEHELVIAFKRVTDPKLARLIDEAAQRGVKVHLLTHESKMAKRAVRELDHVTVTSDPAGMLHANVIIADGSVAAFGSAHATERALGHKAKRLSREAGVVVDDAQHVSHLRDTVLELIAAAS